METKHWGIWSQRSFLVSRKKKALIVLLPLYKEKMPQALWAIQNGGKNSKSQSSVGGKPVLSICVHQEARRSWILFLWLHTRVPTGRSSDPGAGTHTFHNNVHLRRPLDETVWNVSLSNAAYRTYGQVKVRIAASWDYGNNSLFVSINKTNAELCTVGVREIHSH